jgi:hypothetical protein
MLETNMKSLFDIYPEGRLISVIRDPKNWFPSATRHQTDKYGEINRALDQWLESAGSMIKNKQQHSDRVCIIKFEDLVKRTDAIMRHLAGFLDISFDHILLTPTFNKTPIKPNTSFKLEKPGIMTSAVERYKTLNSEQLDLIKEKTADVYEQVLGLVVSVG